MKKLTIFIFILISSLFGEDQLYIEGESIYLSKGCLSCHGTDATGLHNYPSLAKRSKWDLKRRLLKYRAGIERTQQSLIMIPFAKTLLDREIEAVTYFLENIKEDKDKKVYQIEYESWGDGGS